MPTRRRDNAEAEFSALPFTSDRRGRGRARRAAAAHNRRELRRYRAELDERVRRGEISRRTRRRYLAGLRRDLARRSGERAITTWFRRLMLGVVLPLVGLAMLLAGSVEIGPAYAAAHGHGTLGYFVALRTDTCKQPSNCTWDGNFDSPAGKVLRADVRLDGTWRGVTVGTRFPALDSGDPFNVYPRTGTSHWLEDLEWLVLGALILGPWIWFVPVRRLRRARWSTTRRVLRDI